MQLSKGYQLAQQLIDQLKANTDLAPHIYDHVWDSEDQVSLIDSAARQYAGAVVVSLNAPLQPYQEMGLGKSPRMIAQIAIVVIVIPNAVELPEGIPSPQALVSSLVDAAMKQGKAWDYGAASSYDEPYFSDVVDESWNLKTLPTFQEGVLARSFLVSIPYIL